jgi:hypothetical protein
VSIGPPHGGSFCFKEHVMPKKFVFPTKAGSAAMKGMKPMAPKGGKAAPKAGKKGK